MVAALVLPNMTLITQPLTNPTRPRMGAVAGEISGMRTGERSGGINDIASRTNLGSHFPTPSRRRILGGSSAHFIRFGYGKILSITKRRKKVWARERR